MPIKDNWNIATPQGATFYRTITWYLPDGVSPRNITDYTVAMQVREAPGSEVLLEITTANGRASIPNGTDGVTILEVDDAVMAAMEEGTWRFDIMWFAPTGEVKRLLKGFFCNDASITRDTTP